MTIKEELIDELMTAWRTGVCEGLEIAVNITKAVLDDPHISDDQRIVLTALRNSLQESGLECAATGRTK